MEAKNILSVKKFVLECNDMLCGKFFDLNKRLTKFLDVMAKSEDIFDFLADCLQDFDGETEFAKAFCVDKKSGLAKVILPNDDKKRLALLAYVLNQIVSEDINSTQFLETYFADQKINSLQNFLDKIVRPFRDLICKYFEISTTIAKDDIKKQLEEQQAQQQEELKAAKEAQFPKLDQLMDKLTKICNQILALLKFEKKRTEVLDDVEFVTNSIIKECEKQDLMVVNGLVIGLNYVSKKFKNVRHLVEELNTEIFDYYEFLAALAEESEEDEEIAP